MGFLSLGFLSLGFLSFGFFVLVFLVVGVVGPVIMCAIDNEDCAQMQALVDDLDDCTCLTKQPLCKPSMYFEGVGSMMQVWSTVVLLIQSWHQLTTIQFNTLLLTRDTDSKMLMLSMLNFATSHTLCVAC